MGSLISSQKIKEVEEARRRIEYYKNAIMYSPYPMNRLRFESAMIQEIDYVSDLLKEIYKDAQKTRVQGMIRQLKEFTIEELASFDGSQGKPAYVAVNGIVYDVSNEPAWGGSTHFGQVAGRDLTQQFNGCHGMQSILDNLPKVGLIKA